MRHDTRYCGLCKLDPDNRLFAEHLFLWLEPVLNIDEDFGLPPGCTETHFAAIDNGAFLVRRKNLERALSWPLFENASALFVPTASTSVSTRIKRLARRLEAEIARSGERAKGLQDELRGRVRNLEDAVEITVEQATSARLQKGIQGLTGNENLRLFRQGRRTPTSYMNQANTLVEAKRAEIQTYLNDRDALKAVSAVVNFFAGTSLADVYGQGPQWFDRYAIAANDARACAERLLESDDKHKLFRIAQNYLPANGRVSKNIRRFGHAVVTIGMILGTAPMTDSGPDFSDQSIQRYFENQLGKCIAFRMLPELFVPIFQDSKPSHRDFFVLSLQDLIEQAKDGGYWPGSPADAARKSLERRLQKVIRPPTTKRREPIESMEQLMSSNLGIRQENPALFERLREEIPVGIASMLCKQRRRIRNADELIEALGAGKMGLVWNETRDRLVDAIRKETKKSMVPLPLLVELEEAMTNGPEPSDPTASAEGVLVQKETWKNFVDDVFKGKDKLDRLIALRILEHRKFGGKRPQNSELAKEWKEKTGETITGQAVGLRRNKIELQITRLMLDKDFRTAARL